MQASYAGLCILVVSLLLTGAGTAESDTASDADQSWQFRVYLDDSEIGSHEFSLYDDGDLRRLRSVAEFDVKFLFFTAYRYRHSNEELWQGNCLQALDARTVTNGEELEVSGELQDDAFHVQKPGEATELPPCIMTFAYWNADFLQQDKLLNPQTGDYLDVEIESLDTEPLQVRGETVTARHFRVQARDIELELWYSEDNEWLALESVAKGGRLIRYELI